jgi:hypothetical protein
VPRGEAGPFIAVRNTAPGGRLPLNTNGGGLSYMHSGMYGMDALQESVRQVRGIAPVQIPGAKISSATASAACSPPPARSSCRTRRHEVSNASSCRSEPIVTNAQASGGAASRRVSDPLPNPPLNFSFWSNLAGS